LNINVYVFYEMSIPFQLLDPNTPHTGWRRYIIPVCICTTLLFVALEFIVMVVIASRVSIALDDLTPMATEVQTTLQDVQIVLPEMRNSLKILGQLLPDIKNGMGMLHQLCQHDQYCKV